MRASSQTFIAWFFWIVYPGIATSAPPPGQDVSRLEASPPVAPHTNRHITLDVVVTERSGKPVHGLQQQDFTVLDNKEPQTILSFREAGGSNRTADPPAQALVLIDAINNPYHAVASQREQLQGFLRQGGGELPLPMSLLTFPDKSKSQPLATQDGNALADSLKANPPGQRSFSKSQGVYGAEERFRISVPTLEQLVTYEATQPGRKLLIWLGVGWPPLAIVGNGLPDKERAPYFRNVVWLSTKLREGRITVYSVDLPEDMGQSYYYQQFLKGVDSAKSAQAADLDLQVLAIQSGGQVLNRSNDMGDSLASCLEDAKDYYTLSFDSPVAGHADEYHRLEVKIDKPRLTARTRTGYYAQP